MSETCESCEASLLCVAGLIMHFFWCDSCQYAFVQLNRKSVMIDPERCRLGGSSRTSWCNACGREIRPEWYDEDGNANNLRGTPMSPKYKEVT